MVSYSLLAIMLIVSLFTQIGLSLVNVLGGTGELSHPWQPWAAVFAYGWPGTLMWLHLAGTLILLAITGSTVERRLGSFRFLAVTILAIFTAGDVRLLSRLEFNGASAFIWVYVPFLYLYIRDSGQADEAGVLYLMWLIVPLAMGLILTLDGAHPGQSLVTCTFQFSLKRWFICADR